jgi:hypothetical protein
MLWAQTEQKAPIPDDSQSTRIHNSCFRQIYDNIARVMQNIRSSKGVDDVMRSFINVTLNEVNEIKHSAMGGECNAVERNVNSLQILVGTLEIW